jgi:hypothetical protein
VERLDEIVAAPCADFREDGARKINAAVSRSAVQSDSIPAVNIKPE